MPDDFTTPPTNTLALPFQELTVEQLFRNLSYGELSNTAVGSSGSGTIPENEYPKLILYINEGLKRLFTRFCLKEADILVEQVAHVTNYHLRTKFTETAQADVPHRYIKDLPGEPFTDDVAKVMFVYRATGERYALNDAGNPESLFTPQSTILQVPRPAQGMAMSVHYQALHRPLADGQDGRGISTQEVLDQWIDLPPVLHGALQSYVAGKVFLNMGGQENKITGAQHMGDYDAICAEVLSSDLAGQTWNTTSEKLEERGFV